MIEFGPVETATLVCCAEPAALEALRPASAHRCRVAPDEVMLVCAQASGPAVLSNARDHLAAADAGALVLDVSAGWSAWGLEGDDARRGFARLSSVPLAEGFAQGAVAGVPARVLYLDGRIVILTAATLSRHVGRRIREACADLGAHERLPVDMPPAGLQ